MTTLSPEYAERYAMAPVDERPAVERLWTAQQREAIRKQLVAPGPGGARITDADLGLFGEFCARTGLDPFQKQAYLIGTRDGPRIHIGIDGHRLLAANAGLDSTDGPYWCGPDGIWTDVWLADVPPVAAKYGVRRPGARGAVYAVALYREFKGQGPNWSERPAHMLGLVAERHALRKAFPGAFSAVAGGATRLGAVLAPDDADEPDLRAGAPVVDAETGEVLHPLSSPPGPPDPPDPGAEDEAGAPGPTREEAMETWKAAQRRALELGLGFTVPRPNAGADELLDAAAVLGDRVDEAVRRRGAPGPVGGRS